MIFLSNQCREQNTALMREAIHTRYSLLPYYYTLFREAAVTGIPVMRPLWLEFPSDKETYDNGEAFLVGSSLLVHGIYEKVLLIFISVCVLQVLLFVPSLVFKENRSSFVAGQDQKSASVYLPAGASWFNLRNGVKFDGGVSHKLAVSEDSIPSFQRAGTIIPRKDRFRRSSTQMVNDPYTLVCLL